ncbi:hypothetical protein FMEAI12_3550045 [Parafrankia sp. Ea1.12]|nr:hypothetical protein FMEAI12_3550045 [Parafrankia sp. Ea1.12]
MRGERYRSDFGQRQTHAGIRMYAASPGPPRRKQPAGRINGAQGSVRGRPMNTGSPAIISPFPAEADGVAARRHALAARITGEPPTRPRRSAAIAPVRPGTAGGENVRSGAHRK